MIDLYYEIVPLRYTAGTLPGDMGRDREREAHPEVKTTE